MNVVDAFYLGQTVLMLVVALLLAYPVVAYAQNVAYTEGIVSLALSFGLLSLSYVVGIVYGAPWAVRTGLNFLSALLGAAGIWFFARSFVRTEAMQTRPSVGSPPPDSGAESTAETTTAGFEDAPNGGFEDAER